LIFDRTKGKVLSRAASRESRHELRVAGTIAAPARTEAVSTEDIIKLRGPLSRSTEVGKHS
jgi:hypothetical protein